MNLFFNLDSFLMNIKSKIATLLFTLAFSMSFAQNHYLPLYEGEVPNAKKSKLKEESAISDVNRISKVIDPAIEIYLPSKAYNTGKAVLICPGGGYGILAWDKEGTDIAKWLNGKGIAGIVLKYRLPEDESNVHPELSPLMDAQRAMELIRNNAQNWNIDPNQVGIMGFSAGGHLASTLGTHYTPSSKPNFMILIYPVVTMKDDYTHKGSKQNLIGTNPTTEQVNYYSAEENVTKDTPPTFLIHSEDDGAVPVQNTLQLFEALKVNQVPAEMHIYPYGGHGYGLAVGKGRLATWPDLLAAWLNDLPKN